MPLASSAARVAVVVLAVPIGAVRHGLDMAIAPDSRNWTWVLDAQCPECGFRADLVDLAAMGRLDPN